MKPHTCVNALLVTILIAVSATGTVRAACNAPAVSAARVDAVTQQGGMNFYRVSMTVTNLRGSAQPSNTLQFLNVFHDGTKMDAIGVPPLRSGQSYNASYTFRRSTDAGEGTTTLNLLVEMRQPACAASAPYTIRF